MFAADAGVSSCVWTRRRVSLSQPPCVTISIVNDRLDSKSKCCSAVKSRDEENACAPVSAQVPLCYIVKLVYPHLCAAATGGG